MNILFIYNNPINPNAGGIARITYTLGGLFREKGHNVFCLSLKSELLSLDTNDLCQVSLPSNDICSEENVLFLINFIKSHNIDFILNQSSVNKDIVNLLHHAKNNINAIKIITCFHTSILSQAKNIAFQEEYRLKKQNKIWLFNLIKSKLVRAVLVNTYILKWRRFYDYILSVTDYAVLLNEGQIRELQQMVGHKYDCKLRTITNCVPDIESRSSKKTNSLVWCGAFNVRIKRPDLMLRIWGNLCDEFPTWQLYMVGDGDDLEEMKQLSETLKLKNVVFTGRISPKEIFDVSKITCVTSTHESFSLVAVEGMTYSMPVVAFNSFTMAKELIINGQNGYLIENFSIKDYTDKLRYLMSDESVRAIMGDNSYIFSQRFRPDRIYELWNDFFQNILQIDK